MFWADIIASNLKVRKNYIVNDSKTPSGKVHVGSLRGVLLHDFIHKALLEAGKESRYLYGFDDFDPMDGLPVYLDQERYKKYMGMPLCNVPAPDGEGSYAEFYATEFQGVFNRLGSKPEIYWTSELYRSGKFDNAIKVALDNASGVQEIYHEVSGSQKVENWLPFQPICPECGKIGTTLARSWDGKEVSFTCERSMVSWAQGCGYSGKISPFGGNGKLPWKVEWAAKWVTLGVNVEGAGKDHSSKGGSRDVANHIAQKVFKIEPPEDVPYEHILIGGGKMSSSKGTGSSAKEVNEILPPELIRFLFARVPYQRAINFDPSGENTIPDLFDEFDRGQQAFFSKGNEDLAKTWQASQIGEIKEEFNLRFNLIKELVKNLKSEADIYKEAEKLQGRVLSKVDEEAIKSRIKYVKIWLTKFEEKVSTRMVDIKRDLFDKQKELLSILAVELTAEMSEDGLQNFIYNKGKDLGLKPAETFGAVYLTLIGRNNGPKAGALIKSLGLEKVKEKFRE